MRDDFHPLTPFTCWGIEPPYRTDELKLSSGRRFAWEGKVFLLQCTSGVAIQRKRPGRYVHRVAALAGIRRGGVLHVGARWLCTAKGTASVVIVNAAKGREVCPSCEDKRLGPVVYRCFDSAGRLLYVGASADLTRRLEAHRRSKPWWSEVAEVRSDYHADMEFAFAAEAQAIWREEPIYNQRAGIRTSGGVR
jgi:predicted GIY-YIG superfamily endonuclease